MVSTPESSRAEVPGLLSTLILTKTFMPLSQTRLIRRTDLLDRLTDKHNRQVTLLHAPAGYGKSTLLMQWAKADPMRQFGWVTLEETENDPVLLWRYLLFSLQAVAPGFADDAGRLIAAPQPDLQAVVTQTINGLVDVPGRLVVVLDDYDVITNPECHESIQYLIDHLPKSTQIALGTRVRPPLGLTDLVARGMVLELDAADLQFTLEETQAVLGRAPAEQAARIHRDTEGWPVGVFLASIARAPGPLHGYSSGGRQAIRAYLMEQMLDQVSEDDRQSLRDWSILRRINASLSDRVTGRHDSAMRLETFSDSNMLLMSLDQEGHWYRLHDLLQNELRREFDQLPADHRSAAHLRAMEWWLEVGDESEAIFHALEARLFDVAGELICSIWFDYMLTGRLETLGTWIERFPPEASIAYPPLLVAGAWIFSFRGDVAKTRRFAAAARQATYDKAMPDGAASYESAVAMLRAGLGHYGLVDANEQAEAAYQLESVESPWRPLAAALAGVTRYGLGRYDDAKPALTEAARSLAGPDGVATYARGQLALLAMSEGDWEEASRQADLACDVIERLHIGNLLSSGAAQVAAAAVAAHAGKLGLASQRLNSFARVQGVLSDAIPFDAFQLHLIAAETELAIGNRTAATVHAQAAADRLEVFGDGGIFEERLETLLGVVGDEVLKALSEEPEQLTDRELQILRLLPTDLSLRDIGQELFVSRNTAKTHVANLYRKFGVTDRSAAIARAQQLNLI